MKPRLLEGAAQVPRLVLARQETCLVLRRLETTREHLIPPRGDTAGPAGLLDGDAACILGCTVGIFCSAACIFYNTALVFFSAALGFLISQACGVFRGTAGLFFTATDLVSLSACQLVLLRLRIGSGGRGPRHDRDRVATWKGSGVY
ncbi:hypothetical protein E2562_000079 [Oryza meyeriana var. granulata]|uniref:Uncharacterized protein n=1 Tax=Oryza meyeriana var. granulata TaxID=110450 RepID=A0A6G1DDG1_9ORYZ|nr:hypothetical protein E2562_000079 [Oryza meyeriana var. granulata]